MRLFNFFLADGTTQSPTYPADGSQVFTTGVIKSPNNPDGIKSNANFVTLANILLDAESAASYGNMNRFISSSFNNETAIELTGSFSFKVGEQLSDPLLRWNARPHIIFVAETDFRG